MTLSTPECEWARAALDRLVAHFDHVAVRPPADPQSLQRLDSICDAVPIEIRQFYTFCDGIEVRVHDEVQGNVFSLAEAVRHWPPGDQVDSLRRLLPIRGDGCGDYDCVVLGEGIAHGAVVFWDHETYHSPAYLLGGTFASYIDMWADRLATCFFPNGELDPKYVPLIEWPVIREAERSHPWPFDRKWMQLRDPRARTLLADPDFHNWLA